ncbi:hypothetical protein AVEN_210713-1, partial [Araneus ventricosus]
DTTMAITTSKKTAHISSHPVTVIYNPSPNATMNGSPKECLSPKSLSLASLPSLLLIFIEMQICSPNDNSRTPEW